MQFKQELNFPNKGPEKAHVKECVEFLPHTEGSKGIEKLKGSATIFLPGWNMGAKTKNVADLCQLYADSTQSPAYSITSRAMERTTRPSDGTGREPDFLYEEALAIAERVKELGLKEIIIAGHSQGGAKAVDLAVVLKNNPDIKVRGTILFNPVGLEEQGGMDLALAFIAHGSDISSGHDATLTDKLKAKARMLSAGANLTKNTGADALKSGKSYPKRMASEVKEMAQLNSHLSEVNVPVILVLGKNDPVANRNEETLAYFDDLAAQGKFVDKPVTIIGKDGSSRIIGGTEKVLNVQEARANHMRFIGFENSPYVDVMRTGDYGSHALPILDSKSVVEKSISMLENYYRTKKTENSI